ncbi:MAG: hypothetical protein JNN13_09225 [Planctomycetes bacterium]|nr:hypothetical protein [Planctomycetota bacterium]
MAQAFAGPLCRWYATPDREPLQLRRGVEAWRADLRAAVAEKVGQQLVWDEGADVAFTVELGEAGWMALRLFAFYCERTELELPDTVPPLLEFDAEWRAAADKSFVTSRYGQLLACRVWLPGDFPVTFKAPLPDGDSAEIGSLQVLADQMKWLNQRTFQADAGEVERWLGCAAPAGGDLLTAARRGYAGLAAAIVMAQRHQLPVVVREA